MLQSLPQLIKYNNYRSFLKDIFSAEQSASRVVTFKSFASSLEMSSTSFHLILNGKRNLTTRSLHLIASRFNMHYWERDYFEALVLYNQSESEDEKEFYLTRLNKHRKDRADSCQSIRVSDASLAAEWYLPALLIYLVDILEVKNQDDLDGLSLLKIAEKFGISEHEVAKLIAKLNQKKFISFSSNQKVHIQFEKLVKDLVSFPFTTKITKVGLQRMLQNFEDRESSYTSYTLTMSRSSKKSFINEYRSLLEKYISKVIKSDEDNAVVIVNQQLFPIGMNNGQ